jgi:hypothetical protein
VLAGGGEVAEAVSQEPFAIDSTPPRVDLRSAESLGGGRVKIVIRAEDVPAGVARLRLWRAATAPVDGARPGLLRWEEIDLPAEPSGEEPGSFQVLLPPGLHALHAAGIDRAGNAGAAPGGAEDVQALVDVPGGAVERAESAAPVSGGPPAPGKEPRLTLLNFQEGAYRGGDRRYIFWKLEGIPGGEAKLDVEYSADHGATWKEVARGVGAEEGKCAFRLPPEPGTARRMLLRLTCSGRSGLTARSAAEFIVDGRLPRARFLGPRSSRAARTTVRFALLPDEEVPEAEAIPPQPVLRIECYARSGPKAPWTLAGRRALNPVDLRAAGGVPEPAPAADRVGGGTPERGEQHSEEAGGAGIPVSIEDGLYEIALIPEDAVGNRPPLPSAGTGDPEGTLLVDTVRPSLAAVLPDRKDLYAGGETLAIKIRAEDENLPDFPVTIESEEPGSGPEWKVLERFFPRDRTYSYRVPDARGSCRLRITAADLAGNRSEQVLAFTVAAPAPRAKLIGFDARRVLRAGESLSIRWETVSAAGGSVSLRESRDGGRTWSDLAKDLPNQGLFAWTTPAEDVTDLRIRIDVAGAGGQLGTSESAPIVVSARPPKVELESVEPAFAPAPTAAPGKGEGNP